MKTTIGLLALSFAFALPPAAARAALITNGLQSGQSGAWSSDVVSGGDILSASLTGTGFKSGGLITAQVLYAYLTYIDTGSGGQHLADTDLDQPATLQPDNSVLSSGSFAGSAGNTIRWTARSAIAPGSALTTTAYTFDADAGALGPIRLHQYMDEDMLGVTTNLFFTRGSAAQADLQLFTVHNEEFLGASQSGAFDAPHGLVNASFAGWAVRRYNQLQGPIILGTLAVSPTGLAQGLTASSHPVLGDILGPADIVSSLAWDVNPAASHATIVTALGGVPNPATLPPPQHTPEPASALLILSGLGLVASVRKPR